MNTVNVGGVSALVSVVGWLRDIGSPWRGSGRGGAVGDTARWGMFPAGAKNFPTQALPSLVGWVIALGEALKRRRRSHSPGRGSRARSVHRNTLTASTNDPPLSLQTAYAVWLAVASASATPSRAAAAEIARALAQLTFSAAIFQTLGVGTSPARRNTNKACEDENMLGETKQKRRATTTFPSRYSLEEVGSRVRVKPAMRQAAPGVVVAGRYILDRRLGARVLVADRVSAPGGSGLPHAIANTVLLTLEVADGLLGGIQQPINAEASASAVGASEVPRGIQLRCDLLSTPAAVPRRIVGTEVLGRPPE